MLVRPADVRVFPSYLQPHVSIVCFLTAIPMALHTCLPSVCCYLPLPFPSPDRPATESIHTLTGVSVVVGRVRAGRRQAWTRQQHMASMDG